MKSTARLTLVVTCVLIVPTVSFAAEIARLTPQTWDAFAPAGKEVDCIYGDYVLRIGLAQKLSEESDRRSRQDRCDVANPIFVDVDGNGFKANRDLLDLELPLGVE